MGTPEHPDFAAGLIHDTGGGASELADRLGASCSAIEAVLSPILGRRGVAALLHRSLSVASATHPWMSVHNEGMPTSFDIAALTDAVGRQDAADAHAGAVALMRTFHELLASLIGASLTERLLTPVAVGVASAPTVPGQTE